VGDGAVVSVIVSLVEIAVALSSGKNGVEPIDFFVVSIAAETCNP
jgi:hypothetical protein